MSALPRSCTVSIALASLAGAILLPSASASAVTATAESARVIHSHAPLSDLQLTVADPTDGASGRATAVTGHGHTLVVLHLSGLDRSAAGRTFGAHVHTGACVAGNGPAAGPHYNHHVATGITPVEFSEETEVWLDFTVTPAGTASAIARVPFVIPTGAAGAIVLHQDETAPGTGVAGPRLACLPLVF
jgi:hypothetical protein